MRKTQTLVPALLAIFITAFAAMPAFADDPQVTVSGGSISDDVITSVPTTASLSASVDHLPAGYTEADLTASWSWSNSPNYIYYSLTGTDDFWNPAGDGTSGSVSLNQDSKGKTDSTNPDATFYGTFMSEGYYEVCVEADVTYTIKKTGALLGPYKGWGFVSAGTPPSPTTPTSSNPFSKPLLPGDTSTAFCFLISPYTPIFASTPSPGPGNGTVKVSGLTVTLTRAGARKETVSGSTTSSDSIYSYFKYTQGSKPPPPQEIRNTQTFQPKFSAGWTLANPPYHWTPDNSSDDYLTGIWEIQDAPNFSYVNNKAQGVDGPKTVTMTYTVNDSKTGHQGIAHYKLTLHDPFEVGAKSEVDHQRENYRNDPNASWVVAPYNGFTCNLTASNQTQWQLQVAITSGFLLPEDWLLKTLGLNVQVSYSASAQAGVSIPVSKDQNGPWKKYYGTHLVIFDVFNYHYVSETQWDSGGFVSSSPATIKIPDSPGGGSDYLRPFVYMPGGPGSIP